MQQNVEPMRKQVDAWQRAFGPSKLRATTIGILCSTHSQHAAECSYVVTHHILCASALTIASFGMCLKPSRRSLPKRIRSEEHIKTAPLHIDFRMNCSPPPS
jgi:hypothetical protein